MGMSNAPTQRYAALEGSNYYMIFGAARRSEKVKIGTVTRETLPRARREGEEHYNGH